MEINSWTIMLVGIGATVLVLFSYAYWLDWHFKKMRPRPRIIVFIGIGLTVLAMIVHAYWTDWRFEKIELSGSSEDYIYDYREYIYKAETVWVMNLFGASWNVTKLYILPKEKERMIEKITEDVINDLEYLIGENGDVFYKYEVSDDLNRIYIYQVSRDIDENMRSAALEDIRFYSLVALYHNIRKGRSVAIGYDYIIKFIEPSRFDP